MWGKLVAIWRQLAGVIRREATNDFILNIAPSDVQYLEAVAWSEPAARKVRYLIYRHMRAHMWTLIAAHILLAVGFGLFGGSLWAAAHGQYGLVAASILAALVVQRLIVYLERSRRNDYVIKRSLIVMRLVEWVLERPNDHKRRRKLGVRIGHVAEDMKKYGASGWLASREFRRANKAASRESVAAIRGYFSVAALGDAAALERMREDFARVILRVSSGQWHHVKNLDAGTEYLSPPRFTWPSREEVMGVITVVGPIVVAIW